MTPKIATKGISLAESELFDLLRSVVGFLLDILIKPVLRPLIRLIAGFVAVPLFRLFRRKVIHLHELDAELEKDIDQWFRGSLVLLLATKNMEEILFPWVEHLGTREIHMHWFTMACRILLAMGVIESMPDQELFSIIHPGLKRVKFQKQLGLWANLVSQKGNIVLGLICQHINRSSPVFAIMAAIFPGDVGWYCFGFAVVQYLLISLVSSRDKALDILTNSDVKTRREEILRDYVASLAGNGPSDDEG